MAMIYDIFTYNGEEDALDIRLNVLNDHIDKFVIVEATQTFSGHSKPLYFHENKDKFGKFMDKIIYYVIDGKYSEEELALAVSSPNVGAGEDHWVREFLQKESIKKALVGLEDDDICYISDVDEIWNPEIKFDGDKLNKLLQNRCYIYYLNQRTNENWTYFTGTIVTKYKNVKNACLNHLRTFSKNTYEMHDNGGWHFNALGGADKKINSFKHPVYTPEYMKTREKGARIDESGLPQYLKDNKEKYKHLFI